MLVQIVKQERSAPNKPWIYKPILGSDTFNGVSGAFRVVITNSFGRISNELIDFPVVSETQDGIMTTEMYQDLQEVITRTVSVKGVTHSGENYLIPTVID